MSSIRANGVKAVLVLLVANNRPHQRAAVPNNRIRPLFLGNPWRSSNQKQSRRDQILQALAHMLETSPGQRITTARLAAEVGVSEAALYRHFPSKARMFEGLIDFIEDSCCHGST